MGLSLLPLVAVALKASASVSQGPVVLMGNVSALRRPVVPAGNANVVQKEVVGQVANALSLVRQAGIFRQLFSVE